MIYTRKGDAGETDLADGTRVSKSDIRMVCIGELDEFNAYLGLLLAQPLLGDAQLGMERELLIHAQRKLFSMGAWAAAVPSPQAMPDASDIEELEVAMNRIFEEIQLKFDGFVLPGGHLAAAHAHVARTWCRRVERTLWEVHADEWICGGQSLPYLNRLSDFLYALARKINRLTDTREIKW